MTPENIKAVMTLHLARSPARDGATLGELTIDGAHECWTLERDITEGKRAEAALSASEVRYRRLFESAKDGILILNAATGRIVDVNPFLIEILGLSREESLGKKIWELGFFKKIIANQASFEELRQQEYIHYEDKPLETADGRRIDVEFVSNVYLMDHYSVIQCSIRDVTARRKAARCWRNWVRSISS